MLNISVVMAANAWIWASHTDVNVIFSIVVVNVINVSCLVTWHNECVRCIFLVSSKAVQSLIALAIIILMGLAACCLKYELYVYCQSTNRFVIVVDVVLVLLRRRLFDFISCFVSWQCYLLFFLSNRCQPIKPFFDQQDTNSSKNARLKSKDNSHMLIAFLVV
jgi:hypothetical protein